MLNTQSQGIIFKSYYLVKALMHVCKLILHKHVKKYMYITNVCIYYEFVQNVFVYVCSSIRFVYYTFIPYEYKSNMIRASLYLISFFVIFHSHHIVS